MSETKKKGIQYVAVIGTGLMGHGIAQTFALRGFDVNLLSRSKDSLVRALQEIETSLNKFVKKGIIKKEVADQTILKIHTTTSFEEAVCGVDLILESVSEKLELKKQIFSNIDSFAPPHAIFATNTSTLSVTEMGSSTNRPEKTIGMHWFIPPQLTKLIEIIRGKYTSTETVNSIIEICGKLEKTPILCKTDSRGFIVSRILVAVFNEAFWTYTRGEASIEEIDSSVKYNGGFPMGWFELIDFVGLDVEYDVGKILYDAHGERYYPHSDLIKPLLKTKKLGRKTKSGFYNWSKGKPVISIDLKKKYNVERSWTVAANEAAWMVLEDVAEPESIDLGMKLGTGWPLGPCEYADIMGIDTLWNILSAEFSKYSIELYKPCPLLKKYVNNGWIGKKAGRGFHKYN
ncbi:3-hydroxyacyl-CoA dehydrogenase [Candidatus Bathyarchaeota archaeon]|nr:3-hydroxyacyl-CoA dehydrogenase [Candidatus Bathyarchaeota archaeon]